MLPFLKRKQNSMVDTIIKNRNPSKPSESEPLDNPEYSLEDCAKDLIIAVHGHDVAGTTAALQKAFDHMEAKEDQPEDNSFMAQNIKAAEGME